MSRSSAPVTAVVLALNEEQAIGRCIDALAFCDQVLVIDSHSTDRTAEIATAKGAEVIAFTWDGAYPKKKQWGMSHDRVRNDWVLHIDADEIVTPALAREISEVTRSREEGPVAYDVPLAYYFMGRRLRHGHQVTKRSLTNRRHVKFPEMHDLQAPGGNEVEGHYQPVADGPVARLSSQLEHDDPDPLSDWINRHNKYSDWEAWLQRNSGASTEVAGHRSRGGQVFRRVPLKPVVFFVYCYFARLGFLDGRAGFRYATMLSWYYWVTELKVRDFDRTTPGRS